MIDHESQIDALESFLDEQSSASSWEVFIKVDEGTHRAGMELTSQSLEALMKRIESSPATVLHGFYVHAGRSYSCCSEDEATSLLHHEISAIVQAAKMHAKLFGERSLVLSFGATPTVHTVSTLKLESLPKNCTLELHGGEHWRFLRSSGPIEVA